MNGCVRMPGAEYYVGVDNVCAWPRILLLPDGTLAAGVYDQASHGYGCGNVALWVSADGGRTWAYRSTVSDHAERPGQVRMNQAGGVNARGELVFLVSGWSEGRKAPKLDLQVCISRNGGQTWERKQRHAAEETGNVPFGRIITGPDDTLTAVVYGARPDKSKVSFIYRSGDGGRTWTGPHLLATGCGETALVRCRDGVWLAAGRTKEYSPYRNNARGLSYGDPLVTMLRSRDEGETWEELGPVTLPGQIPADLLELRDGRVLMTYGSRIIGLSGVCARFSADGGTTWSVARPVAAAPGPMDCGYPSSVELEDGTIVTVYYGGPREEGHGHRAEAPYGFPWHERYHMGVCRWRPEMLAHRFDAEIPTG